MIGVKLSKTSRTQFLKFSQNTLCSFREIWDYDKLDGISTLIVDSDYPESFKGKVIVYGKDITDFNQLLGLVPVIRIKFSDTVISDVAIWRTMEAVIRATPAQTLVSPLSSIDLNDLTTTQRKAPVATVPKGFIVDKPSTQKMDVVEKYMPEDVSEIEITTEPETRTTEFSSNTYSNEGNAQEVTDVDYVPVDGASFSEEIITPVTPPALIPSNSRPVVKRGRVGALSIKRDAATINTSNIIYFYGITPKSGTTTVCLLLAGYLAAMRKDKKVLLIDLDINKPDLTRVIQDSQGIARADANLKNLVQLDEQEYMKSVHLLIDEVQVNNVTLDIILNTASTFQDKRLLSSNDFTRKITMLSDMYDYIIVDNGRLMGNLDYQLYQFATQGSKIFVADGSNRTTVGAFITDMAAITFPYNIVMSKTDRRQTPTMIERQLGREVLAAIPIKNSIGSLIQQGTGVTTMGDPTLLSCYDLIAGGLGI